MTATRIVPVPPATIQAAAVSPAFAARLAARMMPQQEWIDRHASGTLRKNARLGMRHRSQYLEERTAWEFGWEWQCVPASRVTLGDAITEGDCSALTEAGWHADRYIAQCPYDSDGFAVRYIRVSADDGTHREGVGLVCLATSATFIPGGHTVFAIIAEWDDAASRWKGAKNPC